MKKLLFAGMAIAALGAGFLGSPVVRSVEAQKIVTAAQVNGTWKCKTGEFKILALGNQQLKVEFSGTYEYRDGNGDLTANVGEGRGIAHIEGDTAIFNPYPDDANCKITMKFATGKMIVTQEGNCGFGLNVSAAGTYRKTSSAKPKFDEGDGE